MDLIHLHATDNVAVSDKDLEAGNSVFCGGKTVVLQQNILVMHKVAIEPIAKGAAIIKYGQTIGFASEDINPGEHVHIHNVEIGESEKDFGFCSNASQTQFVKPEQQAKFLGYHRANNKVGTRNYLAIVTTVNCSATVAKAIAAHFQYSGVMAKYPQVDGVIALCHQSGCGMRASGEGFEVLERALLGYTHHANIAGVLLLGLGCEIMQVNKLSAQVSAGDSAMFQSMTIQESGGTKASIDIGIAYIEKMLPIANVYQREEFPASELTLALQCGGSDAFSGITANPALGAAADLLVSHGGTVIYSETPEIYGAEHLLTQRARSNDIAQQVIDRIRWWEDYTRQHGFELNNNPSPGNKTGGITTIMEKSLGAQSKSGTSTLEGVYLYAEEVKHKGLVMMDSPGFDPVSVTGQIASGANVVCFTTGRGSAFGSKPSPCIKLASNTALYKKMQGDVDVNCGAILDGELSVAECGQIIFDRILSAASGDKTLSEELGYGDCEFTPWKIGAVI